MMYKEINLLKPKINKTPKIGVLVPMYNAELFVEDTINSFLEQSYTNSYLYITNDGSTDNSLEVVKNYKGSRIKLNKFTKNQGNPVAMNDCATRAIADGCDFVHVLAADDFYTSPDSLQFMIDTFDQDTQFVVPWLRIVDANGDPIRVHQTSSEGHYERERLGSTLVGHIMYRSAFWKLLGGYTLDFLKVCKSSWEDYDLWTRALKKTGDKYKVCEYPIVSYRYHANQQTHTMNPLTDKLKQIYDARRLQDN